ncbi:hypothetical protein ACLK12_17180 [Escherichia coli]
MKRIITGCLLLNFAMAAQAECNISSSIQNIDYGKRSAAMRQVDRGKTTQLADRTITLVMQCDQDAHIRVQLNTANISNNGFGFGPNGSLNLIASDAFSGSNNLDLALASGKNDNPGSTGTASIREGANKRGNSSRLTQSFHFFMFEPIFSRKCLESAYLDRFFAI